MIPIEEATRSNDILVGLMIIALFLIAAAAWALFAVSDAQNVKRVQRAVRNTEKRLQKAFHAEKVRLGGDFFQARMVLKDELEKERMRRTEAEAERDEIMKKYKDLKREAEGCPAAGTRVKKGEF